MQRRFVQQDVFTDRPYYGNPLAVVVDGDGLNDDEMAHFANWTNLSETTFLLPPTDPAADYRVRIFTTSGELPFAGHPTLGSCHAWLTHGGVSKQPGSVVQECGVGLVKVRRDGDRLAFEAPPLRRSGPLSAEELADVAASIGVDVDDIVASSWVDNGPGWQAVLLRSAQAVLAVRTPAVEVKLGVVGPYPEGHEFAYEIRGFYGNDGITFEDPVTGSLNASVAQWLVGSGRFTPPYLASQGTALGRAGTVSVDAGDGDALWIGGSVVTCIAGTVEL